MKSRVKWASSSAEQEPEEDEIEEENPELPLSDAVECLSIDLPSMTIIGGTTNSGKTNLVKCLVYMNYKFFHKVWVVCPTLDQHGAYDFVAPEFLEKNPSEEHIKKILDEQKQIKKQRVALIMDDCIGHSNFRNSKIWDVLATSARHFRISIFFLVQDLKKISPTLRDNCAQLYVTKLRNQSLEACYGLSDGFDSLTQFTKFMREVCKNYNVVKFNCASKGDQPPFAVFNPGVCPQFQLH